MHYLECAQDMRSGKAMHAWNQRVQGSSLAFSSILEREGGLGPAHLVHIPPVASIIIAASNHK